MDKKIKTIYDYLQELFPNPETELHYSTPFQFMVAVMLSAQATDKQVNKVTDKLFKKVKTPRDILQLWFPALEKAIRSINYYHSKAKHLFATAEILNEGKKGEKVKGWKGENEGIEEIPSSLEELMKLPGIGVKTGKLIANVLFGQSYIAVDTHIHRVSNRLWLVHTKTPEHTSTALEKMFPDDYKEQLHHGLVLFGRYHCLARNPKCKECKLQKICLFYKTNHD